MKQVSMHNVESKWHFDDKNSYDNNGTIEP
jgi:hypothetical protein